MNLTKKLKQEIKESDDIDILSSGEINGRNKHEFNYIILTNKEKVKKIKKLSSIINDILDNTTITIFDSEKKARNKYMMPINDSEYDGLSKISVYITSN